MRNKFFYLVFILYSFSLIYSQPREIPFFTESILVPVDSGVSISYCFRIPYSSLVFEKDYDNYYAEYQINIELFDDDSVFVARQIKHKKIHTKDFNESIDNKTFDQDVIYLFSAKKNFKMRAILTDVNSKREYLLKAGELNQKVIAQNNFIRPLIINSKKIICDGKVVFQLSNFNGFIPFNQETYSLLIPLKDTSISQINYVALNNRDTVMISSTNAFVFSSLNLIECDNQIILNNSNEKSIKCFIINDISSKLFEGDVVFKINFNKDQKTTEDFIFKSLWINKPISLTDPEEAISYLKIIEKEVVVKALLSNDEKDYFNALNNYWAKYDPSPNTSYNELMAEFYLRVDYANLNFRPISGKSGVNTDRGKVFVKFGQPAKIDRISNDDGYIIEKWYYEDPNNIFSFIDKTGTGDFQLLIEE
ncbi:MAG TPA: GWxTD domain-containing protein [Ignavibacteriaceae bacterium]|nr:GWxTD domain-containing protein [Ignavibacteriaceae bacterium]